MRQYIDAESSSSDGDDSNTTPYPPIAYEKKDWSLRSRYWMGDTEALEYLHFTRAEITELIRHLGLAEWLVGGCRASTLF